MERSLYANHSHRSVGEAIDRLIRRLSSQSVWVVRLSLHCGLLVVRCWEQSASVRFCQAITTNDSSMSRGVSFVPVTLIDWFCCCCCIGGMDGLRWINRNGEGRKLGGRWRHGNGISQSTKTVWLIEIMREKFIANKLVSHGTFCWG